MDSPTNFHIENQQFAWHQKPPVPVMPVIPDRYGSCIDHEPYSIYIYIYGEPAYLQEFAINLVTCSLALVDVPICSHYFPIMFPLFSHCFPSWYATMYMFPWFSHDLPGISQRTAPWWPWRVWRCHVDTLFQATRPEDSQERRKSVVKVPCGPGGRNIDPENSQCSMETSLPTPMTARVYVNLPEGKLVSISPSNYSYNML